MQIHKNVAPFLMVVAAFGILLPRQVLADPLSLSVSVNTSSLLLPPSPILNGILEFQYNPGSSSSATVKIDHFAPAGILGAGELSDPGVTGGPLPASVVITTISARNEFAQGVTFGQQIGFDLTFSDPASASGSIFGFAMLDSLAGNGLLTTNTDPLKDPFALIIDIGPNGAVTIENHAVAGALVVTPEPKSISLILLTLAGIAALKLAAERRRRSAQAR